MADISQFIDPIAAAIYEQYEKRAATEKDRTYLGASIIGTECDRSLWYSFRWATKPTFDGRMRRLFATGDLAEGRFVADLRAIGAKVYDTDPSTGKQFEFASHHGHMKGHMDGCAQNIPGGGAKWHVLEFKTANEKSFKDLKSKGVEKSKPLHHAQMQWYMGLSGMDRALYLCVNKNDEQIYSERVSFDQVYFEKLMQKAEGIIFAAQPPEKLSQDPKFYICNMCQHASVCHGHRVPLVSCRTCVHSTPEASPSEENPNNGRWSCAKHGPDIPIKAQRTGCDNHLPLPYLLTYADAIDAGDGWIRFKRKDNGINFIVADVPSTTGIDAQTDVLVYTTHEISAVADHKAIGNLEIEAFRAQFPGAKIVG